MDVIARLSGLGFLLACGTLQAGDRPAVFDALQHLPYRWDEALFSIDVNGASRERDAVINQQVAVEHEAALPGYLTYLRVTSHGDLALFRLSTTQSTLPGTDTYVVKDPLGSEQLLVFYSSAPLDIFFGGANFRELGSDRASVQSFLSQLNQLQAQGLKVAVRRFEYAVSAGAGGTEYSTRSIVKQVEESSGTRGSSSTRMPSRIEFEFDSDRLTAQGARDLDTFGEALITKLKDRQVALEGHTDAVGTDEYNIGLSQRRAEAAKQYLSKQFGIASERLSAKGMGKNDPIAPNDNDADRSRNRRVDFVFSAAPRSQP